MVSPTHPDFFAESANKSEHDAESAYCSGAQTGLPSEEEIARVLIAHFVENTWLQTVNEDDTKTSVAAYYGGHWVDLRIYPIARAILDLIRPAFEAKGREIQKAIREVVKWSQAAGEAEGRLKMSEAAGVVEGWRARALDAEATIQVLGARAAARGEKT